MTKTCNRCGIEKPLDLYYKAKLGRLGRDARCKECKNIGARKYYNYTGERRRTFYISGKEYKKCLVCEGEKRVSEFYPKGKSYESKCKPCYSQGRRTGRGLKEILVVKVLGVDSKECRECGEVKPLDEYHNSGMVGRGIGGVKARCKPCQREYWIENRAKDPVGASESSRRWRELNPEKQASAQRRWRMSNKGSDRVYNNVRKARKETLRDDLSIAQWEEIMLEFRGACALTGEETAVEMDHFIPISIGQGGTYVGNVYPLNAFLNNSKHNRNPFTWYAENKERLNISANSWDKLVEYLAKKNKMTVTEFEKYVTDAFEEVTMSE